MTNVYLKIKKVDKLCFFELSWGKGQQITTEIYFPEKIFSLYEKWQTNYINFYDKKLRGKVINQGFVAPPPTDWHAKLVQAEFQLLREFNDWLNSRELFKIRSTIGRISKESQPQVVKEGKSYFDDYTDSYHVNIFISCNLLELERLPWESWVIGTEFASDNIRIVRQAANIIQTTSDAVINRKARILGIFGDDTNLNFQEERKFLESKSLRKIIDVKFVDWKEGKDVNLLKEEILTNLTAEKGWDILFFAGHSNETNLTGGEIAIAPNASISLSELERPLTIAKNQGLQVAIFNSCSGLSIANKLIDLGISQVVIMREKIHNRVAINFLIKFIQALAEYKDIHECLLATTQYLKLEKNLIYPSSYLIPSLFRHPAASSFRIRPFGFKHFLKRLTPTPLEAVTISTLALISLQLPVQSWLLEKRILVQAIYRQLTTQVDTTKTPPVLLVQIDNESIIKARIFSPRPMNRKYMGQIIDKLVELKASVVGIDYLLDRTDEKRDGAIAKSIQTGLNNPSQPTRFVFATTRDPQGGWLRVHPTIASSNWSLSGEIEILPGWYMQLLPSTNSNPKPRPLASLLALSHELQQSSHSPQPQLESKKDFWLQVSSYIHNNIKNHNYRSETFTSKSARSRLQPLTAFSYYLGQMWLHPIVDFSIPPKQVYQKIPAWKLLENQLPKNQNTSSFSEKLQQQIIIIVPGGYGEAGTAQNNEDNFDLPAAKGYWTRQDNPYNTRGVLTGGEVHAYMTHHYLKNRMVVPIPDLWMIALVILLGKLTSGYLRKNPEQSPKFLILLTVGSTIYTLISLQLYISSAAILLPWFLPTITFWYYLLRAFSKKRLNYE
ncbi:MAG: CHASE2 domain-containing protein [Cyanobacteria bacterium P01_A01_bin.84]